MWEPKTEPTTPEPFSEPFQYVEEEKIETDQKYLAYLLKTKDEFFTENFFLFLFGWITGYLASRISSIRKTLLARYPAISVSGTTQQSMIFCNCQIQCAL